MKHTITGTRKGLAATFVGAAIAMPSTPHAALDDIVIITGESTDSSMPWAVSAGAGGVNFTDVCEATNALLSQAAGAMVSSGMIGFVFDLFPASVPVGMGAVQGYALDCSQAAPTEGRYAIMYASCSMLMTDGVHMMRWVVPPDAPEAKMIIADAQTRQVIDGGNVMLETSLGAVVDHAKGRAITQTVRPGSESKSYDVQLEIGPTINHRYSTETYTGRAYWFQYVGKIEMPGMEALPGWSFGDLESSGTAWISPEVPGSDVVAKFYENFKNYVIPATGQGTLYTAMIEQMADVVAYGMPLETTQTVSMGMRAGLSGAGESSTSTSKIKSITVWQGAASQHQVCGHMQTPEGFEEVSMQQMMEGPETSPADAQQMNEAMQQVNEAMQQLTPEQRQMMEQLGMGGMMPQAPAANPATRSEAAPPARGAMPSSEELYSDDLTQMVQKHLDALGYDTGNTSGEMSLETTIAISQFQAERGLEVTGEVSPQLVGLLSAEVDKRR
jgi:hypothetical protein